MQKGDLVKVSNKGFTAIGYIRKDGSLSKYYTVYYFAILEDKNDSGGKIGGLWSSQYITLLKEVKHEKDTGKT